MSPLLIAAIALAAAALIGLAVAPGTATTRAAVLWGCCALAALVAPPLAAFAALAVAAAFAVDLVLSRVAPEVTRQTPQVLARGVPGRLVVNATAGAGEVRVRQPGAPDLVVQPAEAERHLEARVVASRRGRHRLPAPATRVTGPLGLAAWYRTPDEASDLLVYPDLPAAWRLVLAVRQGRFRDPGRRTRGPLGLGTEFESIRDYLLDDDIRQVNWRATARLGRPMSNQYRVEQDRDVVCLVDCGRLMSAPIGDRTRLDAAIDAVAAVALVADEVGDRCGVIAFDDHIQRNRRPMRRGGDAVVRAVFDLEPARIDSDYELAFRSVGRGKRAFVLVLTDLLEEAAARPLVDAVPVLARRHALFIASVTDPDLESAVSQPPTDPVDVYRASIAFDVLNARNQVAAQLRRNGAGVIDASPSRLATACVGEYLRAKRRATM